MACGGCGQTAANRRVARMHAASPGNKGTYQLASFPECSGSYPYNGKWAGESVLVVGRMTEGEKLFPRKEFAAAGNYSNETRTHIENLPTTALCLEAVEAVYG